MNYLTKKEFANLANVSAPAIAKACRQGNSLFDALIGEGKKAKINIDHPSAQKYLLI